MYQNDVKSVEEIPIEILELLLLYNYKELYRPFVIMQLNKGISMRSISRQTNLSLSEIRAIGKRINILR